MPERSKRSRMRFLPGVLDRTGGDRPAFGEVEVVLHPLAVAVEVAGDLLQRCRVGAGELAFGGDQAKAFDDLADLAVQDPLRALVDELLGLAASFRVERVGGLPDLLQYVQEVEDQGDVGEGRADPALQCSLAVGDDHPGASVAGVALEHLGLDTVDEGVFVGGQAGPDPLVVRRCAFRALGPLAGGEQASEHLLRCAYHRRLAVHSGDRRHPFLVGLLALPAPHYSQGAFGPDHRDAFAVDRAD